MTEETNETNDEVEQSYDYPEYRESENRQFLEGEVGAFLDDGREDGDYVEYDGHYVAAEAIHALSEHDYHARVQVHTEDYEPEGDKCPDCGEEFKSVSQHIALSDCSKEDEE